MKLRVIPTVALLFSMCSAVVFAADTDDTTTFGLLNGRFWKSLPDREVRPVFLHGILDGWKLRGHTEDTVLGKVLNVLSPGGSLTLGELADMVTAAYSEPENLSLPVGWVMMASIAIQRGETTRDLVFPALRKHLAAISSEGKMMRGQEVSPIDTILFVSTKQR